MIQRKRKGSRLRMRRMLSLVMSVMILASYLPSAAYASTEAAEPVSVGPADVTGHWAAEQVGEWTSKGLVASYPDGSFKPEQQITRAEFTKLINSLFGFTVKGDDSFSDVAAGAWYTDQIAIGKKAGFINGYPDGTFKPNAAITRQEAAKIAAGLFRLPAVTGNDPLSAFNDKTQVGAFAVESFAQLVSGGYLKGFPNGTVQPLKSITRAEAVVLLDRLAGEAYTKAGTYKDQQLTGNALVNKDGVTLEDAAIGGNLFLTAGIAEGDFTLKDSEVKGTIYVSGGGVHSIHFHNVKAHNIVVDKKEGPVRVVIEDSDIDDMDLNTNTVLETENTDIDHLNNNSSDSTLNGNKLDKGQKQVSSNSNSGNGSTNSTPTPTPTPDEEEWELVWNDEFDGTGSHLDTNGVNLDKWGYQLGTGSQYGLDGWGNNEQQSYEADNMKVEDGKLVITAKKEANTNNKPYTSGRIFTQDTFTKAYGKFEAKLKLPKGQGFWPAFWMMPATSEYGTWASSGEIDIMEAVGRLPGEVSGTIHYGKAAPGNRYTGNKYTFPEGVDFSGEHVYAVEWEPGEIRWLVDGKVYQTQNNWNSWGIDQPAKYAYPAPFDKPFYMILNLAVGGNFDGGRMPTDDNARTMEVDYVRVYDKKGGYSTAGLEEPKVDREPLPADHKEAINGNYVHDVNFANGFKTVTTDTDTLDPEKWNFVHVPTYNGNGSIGTDVIGGTTYAKAEITNGGSQDYAVQLIQNVTVGKGRYYKLSFDAKSSTNRTMSAKIGGGADRGWGTYSDVLSVNLTDEFKNYSMTFQMAADTDVLARLELNIGLNTNPVWIGNVKLEEVDAPDPYNEDAAKEPIQGNHVYNGSFDLGRLDRLTYWHFNTADGAAATASVDPDAREFTANITNGGTGAASITLLQKGVNLIPNNDYEVKFKASATSNRTIKVGIQKQDGTNVVDPIEVNLIASSAVQTVNFNSAEAADDKATLVFMLGGNDADVTIDNVVMTRLTNNGIGDLPLADQFPLKNGDFSNGKTSWNLHVQGSYDGWDKVTGYTEDAGSMKVNVSSVGNNPWDVMLMQNDFNLNKDNTYVVSVDLKSTAERDVEIVVDNAGGRLLSKMEHLTADYQTFTYELPVTADTLASFKVLLGKQTTNPAGAHDVYMDNVRVEIKGARDKAFLLKNGYFANEGANWSQHVQGVYDGNSKATFDFTSGRAKVNVENVGANPWDVMLYQQPLLVKKDMTYIVTFDARSTLAKNMEVIAENGTYTRYLNEKVTLGETTKSYSFEFTMPKDDTVGLKYLLGKNGDALAVHDVFIDNVRFERKGAKDALGEKAPLVNDIRLTSAPIVTPDITDNSLGKDITLTIAFQPGWSSSIKAITVDGTALAGADYTVGTNSITIKASVFTTAGDHVIVFQASGYELGQVTQTIETEQMWSLVWSDEFNGDTVTPDTNGVDLSKWGYQEGNGSEYGVADWGNNEQQYYRKQNITVDPETGNLVITAKKETFNGKPYTSGRLWTSNTFTKAYGKFEARMKLPEGTGIWPAFWMMPADSEYGGWAASGELDIMEARGRLPEEVGGTIHYGKNAPNNKATGAAYNFPEGESITGYHTYSVEWEPGEIRWYVDGTLYQTVNNWNSWGADQPDKYAYPAPFDKPFYIILNLAVGGQFDGNRLPADSDLPAKMEVDYVRAYDLTGRPYRTPVEPDSKDDIPANAKAIVDQDFEHGLTDITDSTQALDANYWNFLHTPDFGGAGSATVDTIGDDKFAKVSITNGGGQNYALQLIQYATITKGHAYKISFDAKASAARNMSLKVGGDADDGWGAYSDNFDAALTTNLKHYEYRFLMNNDTDLAARLELNLGLNTNTVWIGNIKIEEVDSVSQANGPKAPLGNGQHVYNGNFDLGTMDRMSYWNFSTSGDADASASVDPVVRQLEAAITDGGDIPADITLTQKGINLLQNDSYKLTFKASAESDRSINVSFVSKDGSTVYASDDFTVGTAMSNQEFTFTMPVGITDEEGQLVFGLGGSDADVVIDNVSLIRTTNNNFDFTGVDLFPLKNGDFFAGLLGWEQNSQEGGAALFTTEDGAAKINVTSVGNQPYSNMLIQGGMSFKKGLTYTLEFDVKASVARDLQATLENASYVRKFDSGLQSIGTDWTHLTFTIRPNADELLALKIMLGKTPNAVVGTVWIDNVVLEVENTPVKRPPTMVADSTNNLAGQEIVIPFADDAAWRGAITSVSVNGVVLNASQYAVTAGTLTLHSDVFSVDGNYPVKVTASGYGDAVITQQVFSGDGNLVLNGSFTNGTSNWESWKGADDYSSISVEGEKAKIQINYNGGLDQQWHVPYTWSTQFMQSGIQLKAGKTYELSFKVSSTVDRPILVELTGYNNNQQVVFFITGDEAVYSKVLKPTADMTLTVKYLLGNVINGDQVTPEGEHTITIDEVAVREKVSPPAVAADATDNKLTNPIELTFTDNTTWRNVITGIMIDGAAVDASKYTIAAGKITFDPSLFPSIKKYAIAILANGYAAAEVSQEVKTNAKNAAIGSTATASFNNQPAANAIDGNMGTRWESASQDPQWISLDLKKLYKLDSIMLSWEGAYGKTYTVQVSAAETPGDNDWTTIFTEPSGNGGIDNITLHGEEARHVRIYGTVRGTTYGYSLYEFEVYGNPSNPDPVLPLGPVLTADSSDNKAGSSIDVTFSSNTAWENAITAVKVNNAALAANQYTVAAGKITLNASVFTAAGSYTITVAATGYADSEVTQAITADVNLALGKTAAASSNANNSQAAAVLDGNQGTRWEAATGSNPEWVYIDLGAVYSITRLNLLWETAYGKTFDIQVAQPGADLSDTNSWTTVKHLDRTLTGSGKIQDAILLDSPAVGQYIRVYVTTKGFPPYGPSLWEFEVYGSEAEATGPVTAAPPALTADTTDNQAGKSIDLSFTGDAAWEGAVSAVKVNGTSLAAEQFKVESGRIALASTVFTAAGSYNIVIEASGYSDAAVTQVITAADAPVINLALNKSAVASSAQGPYLATEATDGDQGSRWGADWEANTDNHPEWIYVDLGAVETFNKLVLNWEGAYGKSLVIQVAQPGADLSSNDSWTTVHTITGQSLSGEGLKQTINLAAPAEGQYVRIYVMEKGLAAYGPSLYEIEIY
ncbi:carbohydrate binding domain-containing protein [Paenibacillus lupini]|uniref:hemoblobin-interacting domain-containing protein n=1 Tax=Paenibacillus lupini TaxID=1450204 RepID=UPI001420C59A|nr:carbohydrate binding domain-containing protein [Paenibacillus lupini]NIK23425.1 beta-glucanase (GH16 family) [Paenibacillus lupini]